MTSEQEKETLREVEKILSTHATMGIAGEEVPSEMMSTMIGTGLAVIDALLAIRDGNEWRGETDPKKIAAKLLREAGFEGEPEEVA